MSNENNNSGGTSIFFLIGVVFIILKLTHVIDWSWWWVTAPLWGPTAVFIVLTALLLPFLLVAQSRKKQHDPFSHLIVGTPTRTYL